MCLQLVTLAGSLVRNLSQARGLRPVPDAWQPSSCLMESLRCMVMTSNNKKQIFLIWPATAAHLP